jgi:hypothetical protein
VLKKRMQGWELGFKNLGVAVFPSPEGPGTDWGKKAPVGYLASWREGLSVLT